MAGQLKSSMGNGRVRTSASACPCAQQSRPLPGRPAPAGLQRMRPDLAACLAFVLLAGCSSLPAARTTEPQAPAVEESIQTLQLNSLLAALVKIVTGTPAE